mmetsp:Transcript_41294/g.106852  ORF Transcript_41294/g.106852 Transcript_41294/m.106852 type:complete len:716 (-) Transcript_41294:2094-4241(-)
MALVRPSRKVSGADASMKRVAHLRDKMFVGEDTDRMKREMVKSLLAAEKEGSGAAMRSLAVGGLAGTNQELETKRLELAVKSGDSLAAFHLGLRYAAGEGMDPNPAAALEVWSKFRRFALPRLCLSIVSVAHSFEKSFSSSQRANVAFSTSSIISQLAEAQPSLLLPAADAIETLASISRAYGGGQGSNEGGSGEGGQIEVSPGALPHASVAQEVRSHTGGGSAEQEPLSGNWEWQQDRRAPWKVGEVDGDIKFAADSISNEVCTAGLSGVLWEELKGHIFKYMGDCHAYGMGVPQSDRMAVYHYLQASEAGNSDGMVCMADLLSNSTEVDTDTCEAVKWLRKASKMGNIHAMANLSYFLFFGTGTEQDVEGAYLLAKKVSTSNPAAPVFKYNLAVVCFDLARRKEENDLHVCPVQRTTEEYRLLRQPASTLVHEGETALRSAASEGHLSAIAMIRDLRKSGTNKKPHKEELPKVQGATGNKSKPAEQTKEQPKKQDSCLANLCVPSLTDAIEAASTREIIFLADRLLEGKMLTRDEKQAEALLLEGFKRGSLYARARLREQLGVRSVDAGGAKLTREERGMLKSLRSSAYRCIVCRKAKVGCTFLDCGHTCACFSCGQKIEKEGRTMYADDLSSSEPQREKGDRSNVHQKKRKQIMGKKTGNGTSAGLENMKRRRKHINEEKGPQGEVLVPPALSGSCPLCRRRVRDVIKFFLP